jgi:uncharacterized protein (TIGR03085 family)
VTSSPAAAERALLCDLFIEVGPDAPTLAGDWTTRDLAAHLVVRERRPDAGPGIVTNVLADYSEGVRRAEAERPYEEIVDRVRNGPPRWSPMRVPAVDRLTNTIEFFVHHEDVRRGATAWSPRQLAPELEQTLASLIGPAGKLLTRTSPVGVVVAPDGHPATTLHKGEPTVAVGGPLGECVLFLYGRTEAAQVEFEGPADAIAAMRAVTFGI